MKKTLLSTGLVVLIISIVAILFILYGRGYRLNFSGKGTSIVAGTGLLVLTSEPNGARVYIDDDLVTATDDTINLPPDEYTVRIEKDGYYPWKKTVTLKEEAVTKTDAVLFPVAPTLESATLLGAENPKIDPSGNLLAFQVSSSSAINNGIYVINLANRFSLPFGSISKQIATDTFDTFSQATFEFSPTGTEILATITTDAIETIYLLKTDTLNTTPEDVTLTVQAVRDTWAIQADQIREKFIVSLPRPARKFITDHFANSLLSPEGDKILYQASISATMPLFINPVLPSTNSTPDTRDLVQGATYVYQIKEDKNYLLFKPTETDITPKFIWHPSSAHLLFEQNKRIFAIEYDASNKTTLYAGPFNQNFFYAWPDGSGLIILTNFNDETVPANLYKVGLR